MLLAAGLGGNRNPRDGAAGLDGLVTPAQQLFEQTVRIGHKLLQPLGRVAGHKTRHQPVVQTKFDDGYQRVILIKGDEGSA